MGLAGGAVGFCTVPVVVEQGKHTGESAGSRVVEQLVNKPVQKASSRMERILIWLLLMVSLKYEGFLSGKYTFTMNDANNSLIRFLERAEKLMERLEPLLPAPTPLPDWENALAFRWRKRAGTGFLQPVYNFSSIQMEDLLDIDAQKEQLEANTVQFLKGKSANNVLLTGTRGSGKSSLIKALLNKYAAKKLRVIEVEKGDLTDLPDIIDLLSGRKEKFIIFCDDLSFDAGEATYKALKVILDGSLSSPPDNVLIYATSNRRHLMPEYFEENLETHRVGEEIHPGEAIEEKISLSERFGLWLSFYPFDQDAYLNIMAHWLGEFGCSQKQILNAERDALNWALQRGSRSGRVAMQFARDYAGKLNLKKPKEAGKK